MSKPARTLRITLPWPNANLSPNARCHWAAKSRAVRKAREDGTWAAMAAMRQTNWLTVDRATVRIVFQATAKRRRDADNHLAMLKPYLDGFADAGVIANDSGFRHEPVTFVEGREKCVLVEVEEC